MDMEPFRGLREHPGISPLRGPKTDPLKNSIIAPGKFAENSAMSLVMDRARKNLHPGDPNRAQFLTGRTGIGELSRFYADASDPLSQALRRIVTHDQRFPGLGCEAFPQFIRIPRHKV